MRLDIVCRRLHRVEIGFEHRDGLVDFRNAAFHILTVEAIDGGPNLDHRFFEIGQIGLKLIEGLPDLLETGSALCKTRSRLAAAIGTAGPGRNNCGCQ